MSRSLLGASWTQLCWGPLGRTGRGCPRAGPPGGQGNVICIYPSPFISGPGLLPGALTSQHFWANHAPCSQGKPSNGAAVHYRKSVRTGAVVVPCNHLILCGGLTASAKEGKMWISGEHRLCHKCKDPSFRGFFSQSDTYRASERN